MNVSTTVIDDNKHLVYLDAVSNFFCYDFRFCSYHYISKTRFELVIVNFQLIISYISRIVSKYYTIN